MKVCVTAMRALVAIGDPIAAAPLAELYSSTDDRGIRKEAERALYLLDKKDARGVRGSARELRTHEGSAAGGRSVEAGE